MTGETLVTVLHCNATNVTDCPVSVSCGQNEEWLLAAHHATHLIFELGFLSHHWLVLYCDYFWPADRTLQNVILYFFIFRC